MKNTNEFLLRSQFFLYISEKAKYTNITISLNHFVKHKILTIPEKYLFSEMIIQNHTIILIGTT